MPGPGISYSFGDYSLDLKRGALLKAGVDVKLRPKSFGVLRVLIERRGELLTKDELLNAVWGHVVVTDGALTQCLIDVRRAIGDESQQVIRTVPRRGYIFDVPVVVSNGVPANNRPAASGSASGPDERGPAPAPAQSRLGSLRRGLVAAILASLVPFAIWWGLDSRGTDAVPPVERGAAVQVPNNSIAVLPFVNMSSDPGSEYFCDGISEEILNRLADFPELHVIARTSSFALKDSGFDARKLSGLLGVRYLLQGSVRKDEGRVRIAAQLLDDSGTQVWSKAYDRELRGIFAIQQEIAEAVATSVVPKIVARSTTAPGALPNLDAYQHYLAGREIFDKRQPQYIDLAKEQFRQAIAIDPRYAEAQGELALVLALEAATAQEIARAQQAIDHALFLRPELARAYVAQGALLEKRHPPDYSAIEAAYRKALVLEPNMVDASNWLAFVLGTQGRYAERLAVMENAARSNPLAPALMTNLAFDHAERGDFARAEQDLRRLLELPKPSPYVPSSLSDFYWMTGRLVESNDMAKRLVLVEAEASDRGESYPALALSYSRLGMWERAQAWWERIERKWPDVDWPELCSIDLLRLQGHVAKSTEALQAKLKSRRREAAGATLPPEYGVPLALAGEYRDAIRTLSPALNVDGPLSGVTMEVDADAREWLAWAYLNTGATDRARRILSGVDQHYRDRESKGWLHLSVDWAMFAQSAVLAGEKDLAIDRLRKAVDAGWRDYYSIVSDPRWQALHDDPRFQKLMATVKADIHAQRARLEQIEAKDDTVARLDAVSKNRRIQQ